MPEDSDVEERQLQQVDELRRRLSVVKHDAEECRVQLEAVVRDAEALRAAAQASAHAEGPAEPVGRGRILPRGGNRLAGDPDGSTAPPATGEAVAYTRAPLQGEYNHICGCVVCVLKTTPP